MIRRLMLYDAVRAVALFRDDGALVEGYGLDVDQLDTLARFAYDTKRIVQGHADQLAMFTGQRGWTPPAGWLVRSDGHTVCSAGNLVCLLENGSESLGELMREIAEAARY